MLQLPLQIVNTIWKAATFWPKLFWHLYDPQSKERSILDILCDPANSTEQPFSNRRLGREAERKATVHGHQLSLFGCTFGAISAQPIHLANFFNDSDADGELTEFKCGMFAKSSGTKTMLQWDHGKHKLHFWHVTASQLPEIRLYQGTNYFKAFCTRMARFL